MENKNSVLIEKCSKMKNIRKSSIMDSHSPRKNSIIQYDQITDGTHSGYGNIKNMFQKSVSLAIDDIDQTSMDNESL